MERFDPFALEIVPTPTRRASDEEPPAPHGERASAEQPGKLPSDPGPGQKAPGARRPRRWVTPAIGASALGRRSTAGTDPVPASGTPTARREDESGGAVEVEEKTRSPLADVALPALASAVALISGRGHDVELIDRSGDTDDPCLSVRFLPARGLLPTPGSPTPSASRFELRVLLVRESEAVPEDAAPERDAHVVAGHVPGHLDGRLLTLGRIPARDLTSRWVLDRFVSFVQQTLERS